MKREGKALVATTHGLNFEPHSLEAVALPQCPIDRGDRQKPIRAILNRDLRNTALFDTRTIRRQLQAAYRAMYDR